MKGGVNILNKVKSVKNFTAVVVNCKNYCHEHRDMHIICCGGKFGLAEKHKNGRFTTLIECKYDYIDSMNCGFMYSNVAAVSLNGKWGLYAFRHTVSTKSRKIDCKQVAECEYDHISTNHFSSIIILHKSKAFFRRYYNVKTGNLSPFYETILADDENYFLCATDNNIKWIDVRSNCVIYSADDLCVHPQMLSKDIYLFTKYDFDEVVGDNKSDLVFFNRDLKVSYVIENIDCFNMRRNGFENFEENFVFIFRKNRTKHIIAVNSGEWDIESIKAIAKEIDYT